MTKTTDKLSTLAQPLRKLLQYFLDKSFLSRWIILLIDTLIGLFSCSVALWFGNYVFRKYGLDTLPPEGGFIILLATLVSLFVLNTLFKSYRESFRYAYTSLNLRVFLFVFVNAVIVSLLHSIVSWRLLLLFGLTESILFFLFFFLPFILLEIAYRKTLYHLAQWALINSEKRHVRKRVSIFGVRGEEASLVSLLEQNPNYAVTGFCTTDKQNANHTIQGKKISYISGFEALKKHVLKHKVDAIIFPYKDNSLRDQQKFIEMCRTIGVETWTAPALGKTAHLPHPDKSVRNIRIEDLLMREPIELDNERVHQLYEGKTILVTGAAGSIGSEIVRQIAQLDVRELILFDNAETNLHNIQLELKKKFPNLSFKSIIGDVRSPERVDMIFSFYRPQIVLHAAAYKHVHLMEDNPCESVLVNIMGTKNVADHCLKYNVEKMVMVSTDKAVNPTNVMGACKRAAEIYVQCLGKAIELGSIKGKTTFITTRFGNVLGSQGSVFHTFRDQIAQGGPVTVTDPNIRRFFMSIPEASSLVLQASAIGNGTFIYVFDMGEEHLIVDLAERMIRLAGFVPNKDIHITFTGLLPGEKIYEEVLSKDENNLPTPIEKIKIAQVREYEYDEVLPQIERLKEAALKVDKVECVQLLKDLIPEYISNNSEFEALDKK